MSYVKYSSLRKETNHTWVLWFDYKWRNKWKAESVRGLQSPSATNITPRSGPVHVLTLPLFPCHILHLYPVIFRSPLKAHLVSDLHPTPLGFSIALSTAILGPFWRPSLWDHYSRPHSNPPQLSSALKCPSSVPSFLWPTICPKFRDLITCPMPSVSLHPHLPWTSALPNISMDPVHTLHLWSLAL